MKTNYYVRSPFNYIGNKFRILDQIIPFFDEHQVFVDVFGGSGVVGVNVKNQEVIYNEIDPHVVKTMKYLYANSFPKVDKRIKSLVKDYDLIVDMKAQDLPTLNQEGFNRLKDDFNHQKIKKKDSIPSFIGLIMFGFNSQIRYNSQGKFNIPVGKSGYTQFRRNNLEMFMKKFQEKEVLIYNSHYKNLVEQLTNNYQDHKDYFFYFDPPYLLSNAPYNSGWNISEEQEFIKVLENLLKNNYQFGINNFLRKNDIVNQELQNFLNNHQKELEVHLMNSSYQSSNYHRYQDTNLEEIYVQTRRK